MNKRLALLFVALCAVLVGCATPLKPNQVRVKFMSEPPGAMIYFRDRAFGTTPVEVMFNASESAMRLGSDNVEVYAMWPSGARSAKRLTVPIGQGNKHYTFSRPSDAPGLGTDLAYAAQLRHLAAAEEQASAASDAVFWQMYKSMQPKSPTSTDCMKIGSSVSCTTR